MLAGLCERELAGSFRFSRESCLECLAGNDEGSRHCVQISNDVTNLIHINMEACLEPQQDGGACVFVVLLTFIVGIEDLAPVILVDIQVARVCHIRKISDLKLPSGRGRRRIVNKNIKQKEIES